VQFFILSFYFDYCQSQKSLWDAAGTMDETIPVEFIWPLDKHSWLKWSHDK